MSRAFVKETDDTHEVPDRPISAAPNLVTPRGAAMIESEIAALEKRLAAASPEAETAPLQRDLRYWQARRSTMQITEANDAPTAVSFGTQVTMKRRGRKVTIAIVGEDEADPSAKRIAWTSPLAQALVGAEPGETVAFEAGGGEEEIAVVSVQRVPADEK